MMSMYYDWPPSRTANLLRKDSNRKKKSFPGSRITRIGLVGNNMERTWWGGFREADPDLTDDEIKGCIKNFHCGPKLPYSERTAHGYHYDDFVVKYYQDHHF